MASEKGRDIAILRLWIDLCLEDVALIGCAVRGVCRGKGMSARTPGARLCGFAAGRRARAVHHPFADG